MPRIACPVTDLERLHYGDCGLVGREGSFAWRLAPRRQNFSHQGRMSSSNDQAERSWQ